MTEHAFELAACLARGFHTGTSSGMFVPGREGREPAPAKPTPARGRGHAGKTGQPAYPGLDQPAAEGSVEYL